MGARAVLGAFAAACLVATGCTFQLRHDGVTWTCGPFRYEINDTGAGPEQIDAVHAAVEHYAAVTGQEVVFVGTTTDRWSAGDRAPAGPVLIEWYWPDDAGQRTAMGFAEPQVEDGHFVGGWIYLHPTLGSAPAAIVERIAMHELGHIGGLDDVTDVGELMHRDVVAQDWGPGDIVGLHLTHGSCP